MKDPIDLVTVDLLKLVSTQPPAKLEAWVVPIQEACRKYQINNVRRVAAFIAQMAHESNFVAKNSREGFNYTTAQRIKEIFGKGDAGRKRFPTLESCKPYAGQQEKLANYVYANRMGNRGPESGDGWKTRGGGAGQLTGMDNWMTFARQVSKSLDDAIQWACNTIEGSVMSFGWFWDHNHLNALADTPGIQDETVAINGGVIGLPDRQVKFDTLVAALIKLGA